MVVFIIFPAICYLLNHSSMTAADIRLKNIAVSLSTDTIRVVNVTGKRVTPRSIYVAPLRYGRSEINLNVQPAYIIVKNDTLFVHIDDASPVYQGYIHIRNLQTAILDSDTITYNLSPL